MFRSCYKGLTSGVRNKVREMDIFKRRARIGRRFNSSDMNDGGENKKDHDEKSGYRKIKGLVFLLIALSLLKD